MCGFSIILKSRVHAFCWTKLLTLIIKRDGIENGKYHTQSYLHAKGVLQLIQESRLKVKLWRVGARERKKSGFFCNAYFVRRKLFKHFCFVSMYSVLNKLSEYIYIYIYFYILQKKNHFMDMFFFEWAKIFFKKSAKSQIFK